MVGRRGFFGSLFCAAAGAASSGCLSTRGPVVPQGSPAPPFSLKSHLGTAISLDSLTATGPAVIVFYRGFW
jgi:hypothetical protein